MFSAALPFDYIQHVGRGDRTRRSRIRPHGTRVRRGTPRA
jgi:hypothetical protein